MTELTFNSNLVCKDCKTAEYLRLDHCSGDLVCGLVVEEEEIVGGRKTGRRITKRYGCGLVAEEKVFDEGADWRSFDTGGVGTGADGGHAKQRGDAMGAFDSMLQDAAHGTSMSGTGAQAEALQKAQQMVKQGGHSAGRAGNDEAVVLERKLEEMTKTIRKATTRLQLGEQIVQRCVMFLQVLAEKRHLNKQKKRPWLCALIHLASREEKATQTIREIAEANADYGQKSGGVKKDRPAGEKVANATALEKSIQAEVRELTRQLNLERPVVLAADPELMARIVNSLQLAPECGKPAGHIVRECYKQGKLLGPKINKMSPDVLMAVSIYIVAWLKDVEQKPKISDVAAKVRVKPSKVTDAYLMVRPLLRSLLPKDLVCHLSGGIEGLPKNPGG